MSLVDRLLVGSGWVLPVPTLELSEDGTTPGPPRGPDSRNGRREKTFKVLVRDYLCRTSLSDHRGL